jgi:hypothetical protein
MAKKKAGKNKIPCAAYKSSNTRERNKLKKLARHLKKQPEDTKALEHVERVKKLVKGF